MKIKFVGKKTRKLAEDQDAFYVNKDGKVYECEEGWRISVWGRSAWMVPRRDLEPLVDMQSTPYNYFHEENRDE